MRLSRSRFRSCSGDACSYSSSTPSRRASSSIAPTKSTPSVFSTNAIASPPSPQPKHLNVPRAGETVKLGVLSWWNGHSPLYVPPDLRSRTTSSTSGRISTAALTRSTDSSLIRAIGGSPGLLTGFLGRERRAMRGRREA